MATTAACVASAALAAALMSAAGGVPVAGQDVPPVAATPGQDAPVRVAVALSGGSAKGFAHVGVLRVLERAGVRVDIVTGTSMGSVVGGLYAIGTPVDSIARIIENVDWDIALTDDAERSRRFLHQRRFDERAVAQLPIEGGIVDLAAGATIGSNVIRLAELTMWPAATVRSFATFPRPFAAVATDIETGEAVRLGSGVLSEVVRASIGIPGIFEPFELDGRLLVDGAVSRNLPAVDARDLGADIVVCSDVSDPLSSREELASIVDVLGQVLTLSMRRSNEEQRALCDVVIRPDIDGLSGQAFDRYEEWFGRGEDAATAEMDALRRVAARQTGLVRDGSGVMPGQTDVLRAPGRASALLPDSVRVVAVVVEGSSREQTRDFVYEELGVTAGDYVTPARLAYRLSDLDATGLFGLVRYRLDRTAGGVSLTVVADERPRDRVGVGLRYDDERRAALLFTATMHNLVRYGSVTRLDLRVGEETRVSASYLRRHGVTGRLEGGSTLAWSQSELRLPGLARPTTGLDITSLSTVLGLVVGRGSFVGVELLGEWATADADALPDVLLASGAVVLDHESLDRIDFPHSGRDGTVRWETGVTDRPGTGGFTHITARGRVYLPLHDRWTLDLGGFVGHARGEDLPLHRQFFVGGSHPSAVFAQTHPLFHGLPREELTGTSAQVGRVGLRWLGPRGLRMRAGLDVGGTLSEWRFPMTDPFIGWSLGAGLSTLIGPVWLEWGDVTEGYSDRLSVSVGRRF